MTLAFRIPKPDMGNLYDIGPEIVSSFWTRKVHIEIFQIQLDDFSLRVKQDGGFLAPLAINRSSATVEIYSQESLAPSVSYYSGQEVGGGEGEEQEELCHGD